MPLLSGSVRDRKAVVAVGVFAREPSRALAESPRGKNRYAALVDTGANRTAVSETVVKNLSPEQTGDAYYRVADRDGRGKLPIYEVFLSIPARQTNAKASGETGVARPQGAKMHHGIWVVGCLPAGREYDVLLGMDALAHYSLLIQYGGFVIGYPS